MWGLDLKKTILWRVSLLRRCARSLWHQILACWIGKSIRYRHLLHSGSGPLIPTSHRRPRRPERTTTAMDVATVYHQFPSVEMTASSGDGFASGEMTSSCGGSDHDKEGSDLVALKISLLGDQYIGKTSFLGEHAHGEEEECSWGSAHGEEDFGEGRV
ncbi:uncharacterized protein LOC112503025 [Cynara cardunculus var. scolymus]|uniref:uncharacterized protein LOC112503025 n=1 Tax=Cynara cardunculus var. scolymus TaxID=59895 RepID=UPI000D62CCB9|nr:uncharacterized protein LOC112503025 [Cynara cardunculus var. scolymus]